MPRACEVGMRVECAACVRSRRACGVCRVRVKSACVWSPRALMVWIGKACADHRSVRTWRAAMARSRGNPMPMSASTFSGLRTPHATPLSLRFALWRQNHVGQRHAIIFVFGIYICCMHWRGQAGDREVSHGGARRSRASALASRELPMARGGADPAAANAPESENQQYRGKWYDIVVRMQKRTCSQHFPKLT